MLTFPHQYIDRASRRIITEELLGDRSIRFLYSSLRENAPTMFRLLTSRRMSSVLGFLHYDLNTRHKGGSLDLFKRAGADWRECVEPLSSFDSARKVFERQIRYWETRPMDPAPEVVVSPADARVLIGSLSSLSALFIKEKFFDAGELLGGERPWYLRVKGGDFAVFRLTPDKYHYNHSPVSGRVIDHYSIDGLYHSCNPTAQIAIASIPSKNRRVITVIDTDVEDGSAVGIVIMVEVVALMIGDIVQAYSEDAYSNPREVVTGMFLRKGCPKSLYRPGSSTDVLLFEPGRIIFSPDLVDNCRRHDVQSRFTTLLGRPLVETDIQVRSTVAGPALPTPQYNGTYHV
jgi:phosphatidylserine decarboxylase